MVLVSGLAVTANAADMTVDGLKKSGINPLDDAAIKQLIVNKVIIVRNMDTLGHYEVRFNPDGTRVLQGAVAIRGGGGIEYVPYAADPKKNTAKYEVKDGKLITHFDDKQFEVMVLKVRSAYYAAHSNDKGVIKWELVNQ